MRSSPDASRPSPLGCGRTRPGTRSCCCQGRAHDRPLQLTAHKDEIALIVKRIDPTGRLAVERVGGIHPFKVGEGPVDILADDGSIVPAVIGFGAVHVSEESPIQQVKSGRRAAQWSDAVIDAKLTK